MEALKKQSKERIIYLDILKIFACFFVIVNHTQASIFNNIQRDSVLYVSVFYFFASKISVPVFVMTTGALILKRDISLKILFQKYILKIVTVVILFSFGIFLLETRSLNIFLLLKTIFLKPIDISYWYLYMLVGIYLMSPFIKNMVRDIDDSHYILLFVLWIVFIGIIPIFKYTFNIYILQFMEIPILGGYVGYYIFGDYINRSKLQISNKIIIPLCVITYFLATAIVTILSMNEFKVHGEFIYSFDNVTYIFFILSSLSFFILIKRIVSKIAFSDIVKKTVFYISRCTFGIYLVHTIVIKLLANSIRSLFINTIGNLPGIFMFQILVFIVSFIIVSILIKIPLLKKLI